MTRWALMVLAGCGTPDILEPSPSLYPCGVNGVVCATQHTCCSEGETCGGEPDSVGCLAGYCCADDSSITAAKRRLIRKQTPEK